MSPRSNPPELAETYKQIDEAQSLTDLDQSDDENPLYINPGKFKETPSPSAKRLSTASDASYASGSPRRQFTDEKKDEARLRRATTGRSPVFDKSAIGGGPSSEHLQRRDSSNSSSEEDYGIEPPVKAPATWGSRARSGSNWMQSLTRNHERGADSTIEESRESPSHLMNEVGSRRTERVAESRDIMEDRPMLGYRLPQSEQNEEPLTGGKNIPNTPVTSYPSSTFTKRSPTKRDSHDLIQKLTRSRSPSASAPDTVQTPLPTTTERHGYEKTPVAPGAWIDTPMTQRAPSQSGGIIRTLDPKLDDSWGYNRTHEAATRGKDKSDSTAPISEHAKGKTKEDLSAELPKKEPHDEPVPKTQHSEEQGKEDRVKEVHFETNEPKEKRQSHKDESMQGTKQTGKEEHRTERESKAKWTPSELPHPEHPKSALETVLQDHKSNKDSLDVGDDTIESLQAILDQGPSDDTKTQGKNDAAYEQQVIQQLESTQASQMELNDIERIDGKLQSLADNMSYLRSGLDQLENQMSSHNSQVMASINRMPGDKTEPEPSPLQSSCENCNKSKNVVIQRGIPLPKLWNRGSAWWMIRPTRLGWSVLIPLLWYFLESTMCDFYAHPFLDTKCEGNCLLPDAPRFPFVMPTMLWRWLHLSDILGPLWTIVVAFSRIFAQVLGLSDGYVDDDLPKIDLAGKIWIDGTRLDTLGSPSTPTTTGSTPTVAQWAWANYQVPDPVPEITTEASSGNENWDDISMDEDEFL